MAEQVRLAVSGLGSIGGQHLDALAAAGVTGVSVFDPDQALRSRAARHPAVGTVVGTFDELLDLAPQALIIAAPDHAHLDQLAAATAAGIATLVEKPLADSEATARERVPQIAATGTPVLVGYVLRHRPIAREVRRLLAAGAIGQPLSFQIMLGSYETLERAVSRFAVPEPHRLYRDYSHEWDYIRWYFGAVSEVSATARTVEGLPKVERPNVVDGMVRTVDGPIGAFHLDYVLPRGTRTIHIAGTDGTLWADLAGGTGRLRTRVPADDVEIDLPEPPIGSLRRQAEHLIAVSRGECPPVVGLADGVAAMAVTAAAIRASESGGWAAVADPGLDAG